MRLTDETVYGNRATTGEKIWNNVHVHRDNASLDKITGVGKNERQRSIRRAAVVKATCDDRAPEQIRREYLAGDDSDRAGRLRGSATVSQLPTRLAAAAASKASVITLLPATFG